MKATVAAGIITLFAYSALLASDVPFDFDIVGLEIPATDPGNGNPTVSFEYLDVDLTFHSRTIGLNGFLGSSSDIEWASYGTCSYTEISEVVYCGFSAEGFSLYFTVYGPSFSGEITAVDSSGETIDTGTITLVEY